MAETPGWTMFDKVYIIFPCETLPIFQVMLLITALSAANIHPTMWMEVSDKRGVFVDIGDFFGEGLDFSMRGHAPQELSPVIEAQADALATIMKNVMKEDKKNE
jgi:hypothetical protein